MPSLEEKHFRCTGGTRSIDGTGWMRILTPKNFDTTDDSSTTVLVVADETFGRTLDESPSLASTLVKTALFFPTTRSHKILLLFLIISNIIISTSNLKIQTRYTVQI